MLVHVLVHGGARLEDVVDHALRLGVHAVRDARAAAAVQHDARLVADGRRVDDAFVAVAVVDVVLVAHEVVELIRVEPCRTRACSLCCCALQLPTSHAVRRSGSSGGPLEQNWPHLLCNATLAATGSSKQ